MLEKKAENVEIRVLHVVGSMQQGGTENFIMNVYRNIDRTKVQFDFLVNRKGVFENEIKELGGRVYYTPALQNVGQIKYIKNLDEFLLKHKEEYDIIHSHINQVTGVILERANKAGIPIRIAHGHNNRYGPNFFVNLYKKYLGTKIKDNANYRFACSKQAGEFLYGKGEKFQVINNSIDTSKFVFNEKIRNDVRNSLNIDDECFVIGSVGRFNYQKNPLFILNIFNEYTKLNNNSKLLLIGKGKLKDKILKYIDKHKLDNKVIILEDRKDVNELMQAMDYFLLPSRYEGLGIVLIEAQASGLKCITSEKVVAEEAKVTDLLEFYSLKNNAKQWAEEIEKNRNYGRKDTSKQIKQKKFDINATAKELECMYETFIAERINGNK